MKSPKLLPALIILVALVILAVVAVVALVPGSGRLLPWAGALAGLIAVFQALNLRNAAEALRWSLALAGLGAMGLMLAAALV